MDFDWADEAIHTGYGDAGSSPRSRCAARIRRAGRSWCLGARVSYLNVLRMRPRRSGAAAKRGPWLYLRAPKSLSYLPLAE